MAIDNVLLIPRSLKGSRRYTASNHRFLADPVTLGAGDWWIAFACYHTGVTGTCRILATGAANDTADGFRITYNTTNRIICSVSDGTARIANTLDNSTLTPYAWHWVVWNYDDSANMSVYIDDMSTPVNQEDVTSLGAIGYTHANLHIGGFATDSLINSRIARVCIGIGGLWDETARNDWKNNEGVWDDLAAGTKTNVDRYYMCDERIGDVIDSTATSDGTETDGPIPSARRPA